MVFMRERPGGLSFFLSGYELGEETEIIFEEKTDILDLVFKHRNSFDTHAEGESRINFGINVTICEDVGVNHSAPHDFEPAAVFAYIAPFAAADIAGDIHFSGGFGKREV